MTITQKLLTKNEWSRPVDKKLDSVKAIVLHWTGAPKQTQNGVYSWFEGRKNGKSGYGSAHYCVGLDGDTWQFLPDEEMAYHVGSQLPYTPWALENLSPYPNNCTIGIEMCHTSWEGEYTPATWEGTKLLTALLLLEYGLNIKDITTHKIIVGWKECPQWFHRFPEELDRFRKETGELIENGIKGRVKSLGGLNVRKGADASTERIMSLKNNEVVEVNGVRNGWFRIKAAGIQGYVNSAYITIV